MGKIDISELKTKIIPLVWQFNLKLVVLFGSQVTGKTHKESDIDIGVYRENSISWDEKVKLSVEFGKIFKNNNIDLVVMSSNSPLLMYSILNTGKVLFEKENNIFLRLKLYAWKVFSDSKLFRDNCFRIIKERSLKV